MVIRGRAPLRVSFGGGGTDVAPFCEEQGGAIIGSTINKYAYCSIVPREDDQIVVHSLDFDMTVKYNTRENYVYDGKLDLVTAALNAMGIDQGCEVYLQCDAPPGSGLGTSSTVMVAMLTAMARWKGVMMDAYALADLAYQVERLDLRLTADTRTSMRLPLEDSTLLSSTDATMWWLILCALKRTSYMSSSIISFSVIPEKSMSLPILSRTRCKTMRKRTPLRPCVR